mmetsp:Transcript_27222/g.42568  ORF Transcript_27222/g.42568 Transcript_27222/m.42568 type:complete len:400 (+) Transcript_27222:43-1242(+)|eukprot:CAMPEP_0184288642 /NCGR_PEP_ID=MMETSP1049-20130417/1132_1 /TAXON_ID=77928 /ORGANISM="Proteomonas sulcata, Strain CCMP704" /LENGTH=399 /DNA_ID=CAMNT_0026595133 /DNA_START=44 /DNA_END=1243 /DNA_ORIENTATION=-
MAAARWSNWSEKAMCEDTLITAVRGGEGGGERSHIPMGRGSLEVSADKSASWHIKVVEKASVRGKIFIGVEISEDSQTPNILIGQDWFHEGCVNKALYYSSDGDICSGNAIQEQTGVMFGTGDVVGIQFWKGTLTFIKNSETVGCIEGIQGSARCAVQLHRPGDKLILLRELVGTAAEKDIDKTRAIASKRAEELESKRQEKEHQKLREEERLALIRKQAEDAKRAAEEETRRQKEEEEKRKHLEELEAQQKAEEDQRRRAKLEEERKRLEELRRAKLAREEAARKKAAEEQIRKVARSRGGYYEEEPDEDAPTDLEIQDFLRNCLPLRLTAARQMGMVALPTSSMVSSMRIQLTPQQHYSVKKHLTQVKKAAREEAEKSKGLSADGALPPETPDPSKP